MLKRIIGSAAAAIMLLCSGQAVSALGTGNNAYYITFDEFTMINPDNTETSAVSPYDTYELGGGVSYGKVIDNSEYAGVIVKRDFERTSGKITWEMCFSAVSAPDDASINLRCGDVNAVTIKSINGVLALVTPNGQLEFENEKSGFYGVKADIDIDSGKYDIQVNGVTIGRNIRFLNNVEYLDNFYVDSAEDAIGGFVFSVMRISTGYGINEWFLTTKDTVPDDWTMIGNGVKIAELNSSINNDKKSLLIEDNDFSKGAGVSHRLEYDSDELWFEFQFLAPKAVKEFGASLQSGDREIIRIGMKGLEYGYWLNDEFTPVYNMKKNLWYNAKLKLTKTGAELYLNHKKVAENIPAAQEKIDNIIFETGVAATGIVYIDDIVAKAIYPLPDDYVTEPVIPEKNTDVIVGMQSCNIWREGTHFGWDALKPYSERKTYLGYYDEGSSEVKDWETKWMAEHGVDYEMYCWYRQPTSNNEPIKRPRNSFGLHEGYFNSEYSDKIKFAISWENGGVGSSGIEDFENNVIPYWIEMYFKDDRYLKVDNKPVVGIYTLSGLVRDFGSHAGAKAALDTLDSACRAEGFDGVYLVMTSGSMSAKELENIKYVGIDTLYCYSWGSNSFDYRYQQRCMTAQRDLNVIDMMPTIGMGRDDTPWERSHGGFMNKEDLVTLLSWARDEFMPTLSKDGLGIRMVMLDNWNEFGEGHFFMPAQLAGFDYMDAVREVFTVDDAHADEVPTEEAKARFQHLYLQDRERGKTYKARMWDKDNSAEGELPLIKGYYFDGEDVSAYPVAKQIVDYEIKDGILKGRADGSDPGFFIENINVPAANVQKIKVRMKADVASPKFQIYFITDQNPNWSEGKSVSYIPQIEDDFVEFEMSTASVKDWKGTITSLRVDPLITENSFEIDYIELLGKEKVCLLYIDGMEHMPTREMQIIDGVMYAPAAETAAMFEYKWDETIDGKYLDMVNYDTGKFHRFEFGKDAVKIEGQAYFPLRTVAEGAGYKVGWDAERGCAVVSDSQQSVVVQSEPDPFGTLNFNEANNFQGLTNFGNITNQKVAKGYLGITAVGTDPNMTMAFDKQAEDYAYCNIRIKNRSQGDILKVYFTTETDSKLNEAKGVSVKMSKNDSDFVNYTLDMAGNSLWKGTIPKVRIDPTDGSGDVYIDYIIFSDKIIESSKAEDSGVNILSGGIMDTKELAYETTGLSAKYSSEDSYLGRYSLKLEADDDHSYIKLPVKITNGNGYKLEYWIKSDKATVMPAGTYSGGELGEKGKAETDGGKWQKVSVSFAADSSADGVYISAAPGTTYIDGIRLYETVVKGAEQEEEKKRTEPKTGPVKVLIIGNSITEHYANPAIGWTGTWGMGATSEDKDYVHLLKAMAEKEDRTVQFKWKNISEFEKYFYDFRLFSHTAYNEFVDFDADIIICTAGANIGNAANENDKSFESGKELAPEHYADIVNYFNTYGDAKVIIGLTPLTSAENNKIITQSAQENGWTLVDMSDLKTEEYTAKPYKDADVFTEAVTDGVLRHPGDLGMQKMAERLWAALEPAMKAVKR